MDLYSPKTMRGVIKRTLPLRTFFKKFFTGAITFPTDTVVSSFMKLNVVWLRMSIRVQGRNPSSATSTR